MSSIESVVVFCGSSSRVDQIYIEQARKLGALLAERHIKLIYGAGGTGMMGALADGAGMAGGEIVGATVKKLYEIEKPYLKNINHLEVWDKMAERKISMTKQADAICVMPGGFGTMDEFFEVLTLRQLGISTCPIVVVNTRGFFQTLKKFLQDMMYERFIRPEQMSLISFVKTVDEVIPEMERQADRQVDR